jgi:hypothetical protein
LRTQFQLLKDLLTSADFRGIVKFVPVLVVDDPVLPGVIRMHDTLQDLFPIRVLGEDIPEGSEMSSSSHLEMIA